MTFSIGTGSVVAPSSRRGSGRATRRRRAAAAFAVASETPRIAFAPSRPLFGVPSSSISVAVERLLVGSVEPVDRVGDLAVHVGDRLRHALAAVRGAAVAQLDGLVHAGRRAGRDERRGRTRRSRGARRPRRSDSRASRGSGGRGRWRSGSFDRLLGEVEVRVLLLERQLAPILAARRERALGDLDARAEALPAARRSSSSGSTSSLRATLTAAKRTSPSSSRRTSVLLQLAQLVRRGRRSRRRVRVLEADRLRALLHLARVEQPGQRLRRRRGRCPRGPPARA